MTTITWKKIDPAAFAKLFAVFSAIAGLIHGVITAILAALLGPTITTALKSIVPAGTNLALNFEFIPTTGYAMIIVLPILGAIGGFITGYVFAWIYNFTASKVGGIKIEQ